MVRPAPFLAVALLFMGAVAALDSRVPSGDPFLLADAHRQVFLDQYPGFAFAAFKEGHALDHPRYDVGLFGNSRSLEVGAGELALGTCSFFNFSLSGESIRATVAQLERLADRHKTPRIVAVSVDNFAIQLYANPLFPPALDRWVLALGDLVAGWRHPEIAWRERLRMAWRHAHTEIELAKLGFNADLLRMAIFQLAASNTQPFTVVTEPGRGYRRDGSRTQATVARPPAPLSVPTKAQILPGYLAHDLERLARLRDKGVDVVVYESLLDPASTARLAREPGAVVRSSRAAFERACERLRLECHPAPSVPVAGDIPWRDSTHAPASVLARRIDPILANRLSRCRG